MTASLLLNGICSYITLARSSYQNSRGISTYLPNNRYRIRQNTAINQHIRDPIPKIELAIIETISRIIGSITIPKKAHRSTDVDPGYHDGDPIAANKSQTYPKCLSDTKNSTVEG